MIQFFIRFTDVVARKSDILLRKMEYDFTDGTHKRRKLIVIKSTQVFLFAAVILLTMAITVLCIGFLVRYEVETDVWDVDQVAFWHEKLTAEQKFWFDDGIE